MPPALPRNIRIKLEQTLAQWPQWLCDPVLTRAPEIVEVMTPGISNYSVLVESCQQFVVRIDGLNPAVHGLSRQVEWRTLQAAFAAGLAPQPRYFNPDLNSLVSDYLAPDDAQPLDLAGVGRLLDAIHRLPPRHHRLDLAERILRYEKQLEHRGRHAEDILRQSHAKISALLHSLNTSAQDTVLCHNDLLRANRLYSSGTLWALDWEYCAMASPWYDIAVVINGDALSQSQVDELLNAYLGRTPSNGELDQLHQYGCIYRYLEVVWYLALEKPVLNADEITTKLAALTTMLEQRER
jgi:thiamine kinase-like enzyme